MHRCRHFLSGGGDGLDIAGSIFGGTGHHLRLPAGFLGRGREALRCIGYFGGGAHERIRQPHHLALEGFDHLALALQTLKLGGLGGFGGFAQFHALFQALAEGFEGTRHAAQFVLAVLAGNDDIERALVHFAHGGVKCRQRFHNAHARHHHGPQHHDHQTEAQSGPGDADCVLRIRTGGGRSGGIIGDGVVHHLRHGLFQL